MHLYLIGYRGSGKSTVAKLLATGLKRPLWDTDRMIEQSSGQPIRDIFAQSGESAFRELETQAIAQLGNLKEAAPAVVSLGGGAVLRPENQDLLRQTGYCVWLTGSPKVLYERIQSDSTSADSRPKLTDRDGYAEVEEVLRQREPIYRSLANMTVNTDCHSPDVVSSMILPWAESWA